jgi:adenosylcobinamide kinase/adenosylcobinamide-phosphate guanylyltransferase
MIHLVTGGARSGKSRYAEELAYRDDAVTYVATATAGDEEMAERIGRHQKDRPDHWALIEEPFELSAVIRDARNQTLVIDCLTLYLTNWLCDPERDANFESEKSSLISALKTRSPDTHIVIVTNEVGSGIVPMGQLSRRFSDEAGWLNQAIAHVADDVTLVVSGCPLPLKRQGHLVHG